MGQTAACTVTVDGRTFQGKAALEEKDLIFRGEARFVIPLRAVKTASARNRSLIVTTDKRFVFELGDADAARWASRITNPPSRLDKLGVKAGMRVALVSLSDAKLREEIEARGAAIETGRARNLDMIFVGVSTADDLGALGTHAARIAPAGAVWVVRRKGKDATVTESQSMAAGKRAGLVDVKVVSFSDTHSAEKYVIPVARRPRTAAQAGRAAR
jgi:hypothetical protein